MPFSIQIDGIESLMGNIDRLPQKAADVAALALYEGAGVVADAVSKAIDGIATEKFKYAKGGTKRKPSPEEKALISGAKHGVAKFNKSIVEVNTSVGLQNAGYGSLKGKTVPIPMIANAINSGTSFMQKQPFMRKAFSQSKGPAESAIEAGILSREDMLSLD